MSDPWVPPPNHDAPPGPRTYAAPDPAPPRAPAYSAPTYGIPDPGVLPPGYGPRPKTSALAIAGFVLSLVSAIPLAVILCLVALSRIPKRRQTGRGFAIAGLVISAVWLVIISIFTAGRFDETASRDASGSVVGEGNVSLSDLKIGDCVQAPKDTTSLVGQLPGVPCTTPHDLEVYATRSLDEFKGDYPGDEALIAASRKACAAAFSAFVGIPFSKSSLSISVLYPAKLNWDFPSHDATCLVGAGSDKVTGTLKDSGR